MLLRGGGSGLAPVAPFFIERATMSRTNGSGGGSTNGDRGSIQKWITGALASILALILGGAITWAATVDTTQRGLLQDVSSLKEHKEHVTNQLERIENQVDRLEGIDAKLDELLSRN